MPPVNPPGPTGYGPTASPTNSDGIPFVDTTNGVSVLGPGFSGFAGALSSIALDPKTIQDTAGLPQQNAILIELRVITSLLLFQLGASAPDVEQMRADEYWNTSLSTGTL